MELRERICLALLVVMLIFKAEATPNESELTSQRTASTYQDDAPSLAQPSKEQIQLPEHWQQHWIDEPIFNNQVHVVETGKKELPTLLLIHGLGYNGLRDWLTVIPSLEKNYHVVALDLPGFGQSDPTALQLAPEKYAQLLAWLVPQFTDKPITVIGHSMGAAISLRFAASYSNMVEKLIMVDTAGVLQRSVFVLHMTQIPKQYAWLDPYARNFKPLDKAISRVANFFNRWRVSLINSIDKYPDPAKILLASEFAQRYVYKDRATLNAALGLVYEDFSSSIRSLDVPTHIIWGKTDRVAPLRTGKLLAHQLKHAQLHVIDEAGHVPMRDKPEQFMSILLTAIEQVPVKPKNHFLMSDNAPNYTCDDQSDLDITGDYHLISLTNCRYINLKNVRANRIFISGSIVDIENSSFNSELISLTSVTSSVTMTNVELTGKDIAMKVDDSLIDAAGVAFSADYKAIQLDSPSRLYFSVSRSNQKNVETHLHGLSMGGELKLH